MPTTALLVLLGTAVVANLALMGLVLATAYGPRAGRVRVGGGDARPPAQPVDLALQLAAQANGSPPGRAGVSGAAYDLVVRIVSYAFLIVSALVEIGRASCRERV